MMGRSKANTSESGSETYSSSGRWSCVYPSEWNGSRCAVRALLVGCAVFGPASGIVSKRTWGSPGTGDGVGLVFAMMLNQFFLFKEVVAATCPCIEGK